MAKKKDKKKTGAVICAERKNWSSDMSNFLKNNVGNKYIVNAGNSEFKLRELNLLSFMVGFKKRRAGRWMSHPNQ